MSERQAHRMNDTIHRLRIFWGLNTHSVPDDWIQSSMNELIHHLCIFCIFKYKFCSRWLEYNVPWPLDLTIYCTVKSQSIMAGKKVQNNITCVYFWEFKNGDKPGINNDSFPFTFTDHILRVRKIFYQCTFCGDILDLTESALLPLLECNQLLMFCVEIFKRTKKRADISFLLKAHVSCIKQNHIKKMEYWWLVSFNKDTH